MYYGASMELFKFAERMRHSPTESEVAMWNLLKLKALSGYKFRRQHPIATYIADFYSHELRMVIEVDGGYHLCTFQKEYDDFRDEDMAALGILVIRVTNEEVIKRGSNVQQKLLDRVKQFEQQNSAAH